MATNTAGNSARQFPWQVQHYIYRGGPSDPVLPATGGPPVTTGGIFGFNSSYVAPPLPGSAAPRPMAINLTGTQQGGIYIGTIPQGCWVNSIQFKVYTAFSGGANTAIGVSYLPANTAYGSTMTLLGAIVGSGAGTGPLAGTFGSPGAAALANNGFTVPTAATYAIGPDAAVNSDLDLYVWTGVGVAGTVGAAFTAGQASVLIGFTGLPG